MIRDYWKLFGKCLKVVHIGKSSPAKWLASVDNLAPSIKNCLNIAGNLLASVYKWALYLSVSSGHLPLPEVT